MHTVPVIGSHWEGCWLAHHDCAVKMICKLQTEVEELKERLRKITEANDMKERLRELARRAEC